MSRKDSRPLLFGLSAVNKPRKVLGLPEITTLTKETTVSDGIALAPSEVSQQTKESALADINELTSAIETDLQPSTGAAIKSILDNIALLESNPSLLPSIRTRALLQTGLDLLEGPYCPLCDTDWNIEELRAHLQEKLQNSKSDQILESGQVVSVAVTSLLRCIEPLTKLPEVDKEKVRRLGEWYGNLQTFSKSLTSVEGAIALKDRLKSGWVSPPPPTLISDLEAVKVKVLARPGTKKGVRSHCLIERCDE